MDFPPLIAGRFIKRENRFRALVSIESCSQAAHVPNSGRLLDLFKPGRRVWLAPADKPGRKTNFDLKLVELETGLVCVNARLPNPIFAEAVKAGCIPDLVDLEIRPEVKHGESRLDFQLSGEAGVCWVETKSVTLVEGGVARFPDAPTARGRRHLETLRQAVEAGDNALVVFIVQREDPTSFAPLAAVDPDFDAALRAGRTAGVAVRAFACKVSRTRIAMEKEIPVDLM